MPNRSIHPQDGGPAGPSKVHLVSLGCARNRVDSEVILGSLLARGWAMTNQPEGADLIVVNTCGFVDAAKEESIDTILEMAEYKKSSPELRLVVSGCLTQRYRQQLVKGLPEVDLFVGTDEFPRIPDLLAGLKGQSDGAERLFAKRTHYLYSDLSHRLNTLAQYSAYVKVAEGCQHSCSFCIIPAIRGRLRSRPLESIVREVELLVAQGVVEVNLIAQDLAAYGRDRGKDELEDLLRSLENIEGLRWIRMLYMYPENISDSFVDRVSDSSKICHYLDVPVQHASDRILKAMNRDITSLEIRNVVARLRARIPSMTLRTTVMVGFPGETEGDFDDLKAFVREMAFDHLGCFAYSQESGTVAGRLKDQVPQEIKDARLAEVMALQFEHVRRRLEGMVGREETILVERAVGDHERPSIVGRLRSQAPEVDGVVHIVGTVGPGPFARVRVDSVKNYDLVATALSDPESAVAPRQWRETASCSEGLSTASCPVSRRGEPPAAGVIS